MEQDGVAVFRLEGSFDRTAALELRERVMGEDGRPAILDFSLVDRFDDSTLALLTVNLVLLHRQGRSVELRGLRDHQLQLLHHFGVELARDGAVLLNSEDERGFTG